MPVVSKDQRKALLRYTGVNLAVDGKSVMSYCPGKFQSGLNFLIALPFLPAFINRAHLMQLMFLFAIMHLNIWVIAPLGQQGAGKGMNKVDMTIIGCYNNIAALSRYVLGLFVSLVLARTYYSNRGVFGTVFGNSMGLAQLSVSWIRPPPAHAKDVAAKESAKRAQDLVVRWLNAAFFLMWLEIVPGKSVECIGEEIVKPDLLTKAEWSKIEKLSSRCTHIYQWLSNVLTDLHGRRYIASSTQLVKMCELVDSMRGANVWGLPSLPIAYTQIITHMVKMHVFMLALANGSLAAEQTAVIMANGSDWESVFVIIVLHFDLLVHNYLFQGLLDLHGALYSPNSGTLLGHLPALNFMKFVQDVTQHLVTENDTLPYSLELADVGSVDEIPGKI